MPGSPVCGVQFLPHIEQQAADNTAPSQYTA